MEKKETLPNSGEQIPLSNDKEELATSPSAEGRTYHLKKHVEMTFPFHENQERPVPSTSSVVGPVRSTSSVVGPVLSTRSVVGPVPSKSTVVRPVLSTSSVVGPVPSTSTVVGPVPSTSTVVGPVPSTSTVVRPVPLSSFGQPSCSRQRVKYPVKKSESSDPDTAESSRTVSLVGSAPSTSGAAVAPVPSTSSEQQSSGHQHVFLFGENSDNSDTETAESSSSDDGLPFVPFGSRRRCIYIPVQIERVPRHFNIMEMRYRVDSSLTSAENAVRNYVWDVHHFREISTSLEALVAKSLTVRRHRSYQVEVLRRYLMINYFQEYNNCVNICGGYYSILIDKAEVQKNLLETYKNRLEIMMEGPINLFEADEIYNAIDDLRTRLYFTNLLSSGILKESNYLAAKVRRYAVSIRQIVAPIEQNQQD